MARKIPILFRIIFGSTDGEIEAVECFEGKYNKNKSFFDVFVYIIDPNRPFPSYPKPLLQSEAKCKVIDMKMIFYFFCKWYLLAEERFSI